MLTLYIVPGICFEQSLVLPEKFQHILRVMNTNIDGRRKIPFALTAIKVGNMEFDAVLVSFI
jgi:hypothetical protein